MSHDDTFDGKAAGQSNPYTRGRGAPALDHQGQVPNLKRVCLYQAVVWTIRTLQPVTAVAASEVMTILAMPTAGHQHSRQR